MRGGHRTLPQKRVTTEVKATARLHQETRGAQGRRAQCAQGATTHTIKTTSASCNAQGRPRDVRVLFFSSAAAMDTVPESPMRFPVSAPHATTGNKTCTSHGPRGTSHVSRERTRTRKPPRLRQTTLQTRRHRQRGMRKRATQRGGYIRWRHTLRLQY